MATDNTGTANSPYDSITVETIAGEIQAGPHNTNVGNLKTAGQSHAHPLDAQVGRDSMKSNFRPPDTGDSTNKWRMVCGTSSITISAGSGVAVVTFATDADQGDPAFSVAPIVVAAVGPNLMGGVDGISTTGCVVHAYKASGAGGGTTTAQWIAYGKIA